MRFCFVYVIFLGDLKILKDLVTRKKLFAKDFAILEGDMGFKPLYHKDFRAWFAANSLQLCRIGPVNDCGGLADGLPALDIVAQGHG